MHCPKLSNLKINPLKVFYQNLLYDDIVHSISSVVINKEVIYKKNIDNTIFIYYRKTTDNKFNGELITNKISYVLIGYDIWSSIQHTDGWCYDCVGMPRFDNHLIGPSGLTGAIGPSGLTGAIGPTNYNGYTGPTGVNLLKYP